MTDYTLLGGLTGPGSNAGDPTQINLGLLFKVTSECWLKALRFWRADTGVGGSPAGRLYTYVDEDNGNAVTGTDATFALSGTGWQQADITPVELAVNQLYKVVINFPDNYNGTGGFWATGDGVGGIVSGPLTAPDAGGTPLGIGGVKQGTFSVGASLAYPTSYFGGGNYWVDILVTDVDPDSGQTAVLGTATETDTALPLGRQHVRTLGVASSADTALPLGRVKVRTLGTAVDTSAALPVGRSKVRALGVGAEMSIALPLGAAHTRTLGVATSTEEALAFGRRKSRVLGTAAEADLALALAPSGGVQLVWPPRAGEFGVEHLITAGEVGVD